MLFCLTFAEEVHQIIREAPEFGTLFRKYLPLLKFKPFCIEWFMLGVKKIRNLEFFVLEAFRDDR